MTGVNRKTYRLMVRIVKGKKAGSSALSMLNQSAKKLKVLLYKKNRHYF
jgi:hypothetical protein